MKRESTFKKTGKIDVLPSLQILSTVVSECCDNLQFWYFEITRMLLFRALLPHFRNCLIFSSISFSAYEIIQCDVIINRPLPLTFLC